MAGEPPRPEDGQLFSEAINLLRRAYAGIDEREAASELASRLHEAVTRCEASGHDFTATVLGAAAAYMEGDAPAARGRYFPLLGQFLRQPASAAPLLRLLSVDAQRQDLFAEYAVRLLDAAPNDVGLRMDALPRLAFHGDVRRLVALHETQPSRHAGITDLLAVYQAYERVGRIDDAHDALLGLLTDPDESVTIVVRVALPEVTRMIAELSGIGPIVNELLVALADMLPARDDARRNSCDWALIGLVSRSDSWETARLFCELCLAPDAPADMDASEWLLGAARGVGRELEERAGKADVRGASLMYEYAYRLSGEIWDLWSAISMAANCGRYMSAVALSRKMPPTIDDAEIGPRVARTLANLSFQILDPVVADELRLASLRLEPATLEQRPILGVPAAERQATLLWESRESELLDELDRLWKDGDWSGAWSTARAATLDEQTGPLPLGIFADVLVEAGQHEEASRLTHRLVNDWPDDPALLQKLSMLAVWAGDDAGALRYAEQAAAPTGRRYRGMSQFIDWLASLDLEAARAAADALLGDARYRIAWPAIEVARAAIKDGDDG